MVEFWYGVVAVMLTLYVVMDGFDLGAGTLHLFVARTNEERREVLAAHRTVLGWKRSRGCSQPAARSSSAFPPVLARGVVGVLLCDLPGLVVPDSARHLD